jgi:hypothetical protein
MLKGNVEKGRYRPFVVLTYWPYAPRAKAPAALLSAPFEHPLLLMVVY